MNVNADLGGIEVALDKLAEHVGTYVNNGSIGEHKLKIFTGESGIGFHPVLIALEPSDTMEDLLDTVKRIATAFERIADALTTAQGGKEPGVPLT